MLTYFITLIKRLVLPFFKISTLAGLTFLISSCSPFFIFPGGHLEGETAAPLEDWAFTRAIKTVQIETRPKDPYSVNIWIIDKGPALYIHAGANQAEWVTHLESDPRIRVRIEETVYDMQAFLIREQEEFDTFADLYETKYDRRPRNENVSEIYLFRLENGGVNEG